MKKAVIVWSSPNTDGLTASAKDRILNGLADAGVSVEEIHLNRKKLEHCRACGNGWGTCNKTGAGLLADDSGIAEKAVVGNVPLFRLVSHHGAQAVQHGFSPGIFQLPKHGEIDTMQKRPGAFEIKRSAGFESVLVCSFDRRKESIIMGI